VELDPDVVLVVFLPPLLYGSSIYANFNDFRANLRGLTLNTVGLVLATMCAVAWAAHALIPGLPWAAASVLGAIVSPTDPLAAATIMRRLDAPRRLVSSIEGEGLFNDATALVAYRVAVAAVVAGNFSLADAGLEFVLGPPNGELSIEDYAPRTAEMQASWEAQNSQQGDAARRAQALLAPVMTTTFPSMLLLITSMLLLIILTSACHDIRSATRPSLQLFGVPSPLHSDL
jgi:hypothetical protein